MPTNPVSDIAYDGAVTVVQTTTAGVEFVGAGVCDPFDAGMTMYHCVNGDCSTGAVVGAVLPIVSGRFGHIVEEALENSKNLQRVWDKIAIFKYDGFNKLGANEKKIANDMIDRFQQRYLAGTGEQLSNIRNINYLGDGLSEIKSNQGVRVYIDKYGNVLGVGNKNTQNKDIQRLKNLLREAGYQ